MNKYKLVPYLVLSKEDAQVETMQDELTSLLLDNTIDPVTKRALLEDLLNKIARFKENHSQSSVVRLKDPVVEQPKIEPSKEIKQATKSVVKPKTANKRVQAVPKVKDSETQHSPGKGLLSKI